MSELEQLIKLQIELDMVKRHKSRLIDGIMASLKEGDMNIASGIVIDILQETIKYEKETPK